MIMKLLPSADHWTVVLLFWLSLSSITLSWYYVMSRRNGKGVRIDWMGATTCLNDTLTSCRNCSLKPALLGFFLAGGSVGAAAAAASAKVGNPGWDAGSLAADESVADADDGSFVVLFLLDMSSHRIRGCFFLSGLDDTLLESSLQSAASSLRASELDDIVDRRSDRIELKGGFRMESSLKSQCRD